MIGMSVVITEIGQEALFANSLSKADARIFWWFVLNLPASGAKISHAKIAEQCAVNTTSVSRSVINILKSGLVTRVTKIGTSYYYCLNEEWFKFV